MILNRAHEIIIIRQRLAHAHKDNVVDALAGRFFDRHDLTYDFIRTQISFPTIQPACAKFAACTRNRPESKCKSCDDPRAIRRARAMLESGPIRLDCRRLNRKRNFCVVSLDPRTRKVSMLSKENLSASCMRRACGKSVISAKEFYPLLVKPMGDLIGTIRWLGDPAQLVEMQRFDVGYGSDVHREI